MTDPVAGDRVVVRFRLAPGAPVDWRGTPGASYSDVTGILRSAGEPLVVERDGIPLTIPQALVTHIRTLSLHPVRNRDIRSLEVAAACGWPGTEQTVINGWLARAGRGCTRRANSAVPVEAGARLDTETIAALSRWYSDRDLAGLAVLVDRLTPHSHRVSGLIAPAAVLVRDLPSASTPPLDVELAERADHAWVAAYFSSRSGNVELPAVAPLVHAVSGGRLVFATIRNGKDAVAIGRGALTNGSDTRSWLGISAIWTAPRMRGQGLAEAVMSALLTWGSDASAAYLQVADSNRLASAWYRRIGFGLHHRYAYIPLTHHNA